MSFQSGQSGQPAPREIPPGWYADPGGAPMSRYWDGDSWTEQTGPALTAPTQRPTFPHVSVDAWGQPVSRSSRLAAGLLCAFLGVFGVHRFYVGKVGTGILQLVTVGGLGIWWLIDLVLIFVGSFRDKQGRRLLNW